MEHWNSEVSPGEHDVSLLLLLCDAACPPTDRWRCLGRKRLPLGEENICMSSHAALFALYGAASQAPLAFLGINNRILTEDDRNVTAYGHCRR
jgi:hypothetical protein